MATKIYPFESYFQPRGNAPIVSLQNQTGDNFYDLDFILSCVADLRHLHIIISADIGQMSPLQKLGAMVLMDHARAYGWQGPGLDQQVEVVDGE